MISGKSKTLEKVAILTFKDDITAGNKEKHDVIKGKGKICAQISEELFTYLGNLGVRTHYVKMLGDNRMLVKPLEMIPIEFVVRNYAAGSICNLFKESYKFEEPLLEYYLKDDDLGDPLLTVARMKELALPGIQDLPFLRTVSLLINDHLIDVFDDAGFKLVDFKLEFGYDEEGNIVLGDEISPDSCRLWKYGQSYDKDIYRNSEYRDILEAYEEVLRSLK